ncbi:hypothetical protein LVD15_11980 [Fulvivirga maritima]|uniref:hypothetical protein n=1 Tax=Fulvivirga maritima TaxID=2904247 RepID=UPI001F3ACE57|nr:hypothetical protein [Fulvivirga maritima]UII29114.1 hypothetical protein LVD15_11980 [Fulvivirga maritima]
MKRNEHYLHRLETIITKDLPDALKHNYPMTEELEIMFEEFGHNELEGIQDRLIVNLIFLNESNKRKLIRLHQHALLQLESRLTKLLGKRELLTPQNAEERIGSTLYHILESLLDFMDQYAKPHLDAKMSIPKTVRQLLALRIEQDMMSLLGKLDRAGVDADILEVLSEVFVSFSNKARKGHYLRYGYWRYLRTLIQHLNKCDTEEYTSQSLRKILIFYNFNNLKFHELLTSEMRSAMEEADLYVEKMSLLTYYSKELEQLPNQDIWHLNPGPLKLKDQLIFWLKKEKKYLKYKLKQDQLKEQQQIPYRLNFNLSVSQLALLLRVLIEKQVLQAKSVNAMVKLFSRLCSTKETESLSYRSFYNKYYDNEEGTRQHLRQVLQKLITHIDEV